MVYYLNKPRHMALGVIIAIGGMAMSEVIAQQSLTQAVDALALEIRKANAVGNHRRVEDLLEKLIHLGPEKMPVIRDKIQQPDTDRFVKFFLLQSIWRTEGDEATHTLLDIALNEKDPYIARTAGVSIGERIIRRPIVEGEWKILTAKIENDADSVEAAQLAYALGRAEFADSGRLAPALVKRYIKEAADAKDAELPPVYHAYISAKAFHINSFLRAFQYMEADVALPLLERAMRDENDSWMHLCLALARGMVGDDRVAGSLEALIENQAAEVSIRALALKAYGNALEGEALPVLEKYSKDMTPGPNPKAPPLSITARNTIVQIQRGK